jgi:hypothetical protein
MLPAPNAFRVKASPLENLTTGKNGISGYVLKARELRAEINMISTEILALKGRKKGK